MMFTTGGKSKNHLQGRMDNRNETSLLTTIPTGSLKYWIYFIIIYCSQRCNCPTFYVIHLIIEKRLIQTAKNKKVKVILLLRYVINIWLKKKNK